jgi:hypothetical protein
MLGSQAQRPSSAEHCLLSVSLVVFHPSHTLLLLLTYSLYYYTIIIGLQMCCPPGGSVYNTVQRITYTNIYTLQQMIHNT